MMSFELLLDPATDARVRAEWNALLLADLPSQARHTGASNAPHITLLAARAVDAALRPAAPPARHAAAVAVAGAGGGTAGVPGLELPVPVQLSGLVVFGAPPRGLMLARLVAVSRPLQVLHTSVHRRASGAVDLSEQTAPDHWTPHITLASRLTPAQLATAIEVLAAHEASGRAVARSAEATAGDEARVVALRHWNGDTKTVTSLA